ncbi:MAG: deoxyuridine 5'-triphosphate nucleotidohydrolase [Dehalococcoidales bacterium]|nr:deoxyuridine 5'-triphosphate nucleotidohydrolase [Dehalococcoidales bacterium]
MRTVLSKKDIRALMAASPPLIEAYMKLEEQLQPNGFDLTLGEAASLQSAGTIGLSNEHRVISEVAPLEYGSDGFLELEPGPYAITFNEIVHLPGNIMALGFPRSSLLRCGVTIYNAVWDAGYSGRSRALLVVYNSRGFRVQRNARVDQLVFYELAEETEGYNGIYQGENIADKYGR